MKPSAAVRALLFDLGGVVVDIDFGRALALWQPHSRLAPQRLRELFVFDEPYRRHETGRLAADGYFAHLRELLALDCGEAVVRNGWNAILVSEIEEATGLIDTVRGRVPCYAVSNTNAVHVAEMERAFPGLLARFDKVFTSHEIGHRKPDAASFGHVLDEIGVPAGNVLFFDDLQANVDGAIACGLQGVLVRGPDDVRSALLTHGLL